MIRAVIEYIQYSAHRCTLTTG